MMDITFRRDPYNFRPRINKHQSVKDCQQKAAGKYFLMEEGEAERTAVNDDDETQMAQPGEEKKQPA